MIKPGDKVRYLNAVGGGIVVRVTDSMAIVDDDGFETPVPLRECVVVGTATSTAATPKISGTDRNDTAAERYTAPVVLRPTEAPRTSAPVVETPGGDSMNVVLGFLPANIKGLSQSSLEAYAVNDSNYYLYLTIARAESAQGPWTHLYDGLIEPNMQNFLFEVENRAINTLSRLSVQYVAFKRGKEFALKQVADRIIKVDTTKFAKLHCYRPGTYFDEPAITYDITVDDTLVSDPAPIDIEALTAGMRPKAADRRPAPRRDVAKPKDDIIVVDLHASELLDSTAGLSPADILNLQIDRFTEVMKQNRNRAGQRIVFIHGKGEGILRQALMKELTHRWRGHDVQDASFQQYGYGATQVTIRPNRK